MKRPGPKRNDRASGLPAKALSAGAFTFLEVLIGMTILVWFLASLYVAGFRVTQLLEAQREVVAASQLIQERTEQFRSTSYSQLTNAAYVQASVLNTPTNSEAVLHSLVEVLTVSAYPPASSTPIQVTRQQDVATGNSTNSALATVAAVRLDYQLSWLSQRGTTRTRQISTIVANGGINH